jgi:predicted adenine nucleotide alpha hydrolase (AANH) superfamily ATPase
MSFRKDNRTVEEINADVKLLSQKPEIDRKLAFYEGTMYAIEKMFNNIDDRINKGYLYEERTIFGFIKIKVKKFLDEYDIGKLEVEKHELEAEVFAKQGFYKQWLNRSKEYETRFEEITLECNEHFDDMFEKAKEIAVKHGQLRLGTTIQQWEKEENPDQKKKNDFYLYMRREVTNHFNSKKNKN